MCICAIIVINTTITMLDCHMLCTEVQPVTQTDVPQIQPLKIQILSGQFVCSNIIVHDTMSMKATMSTNGPGRLLSFLPGHCPSSFEGLSSSPTSLVSYIYGYNSYITRCRFI